MTRSLFTLCAIALPASAATVSFTPDSLSDFSGSGSIVYQLASSTAVANLTDPTTETPNALRLETLVSVPDQVVYTYNWQGATISPAALGAIDSIDFSVEVSDPNLSNLPGAIYFGLQQGGNLYFYQVNGSEAYQFEPAQDDSTFVLQDASDLTAADFALFPGTGWKDITADSNPDFSAAGSEIQLVYGVISATANNNLQRFIDFRNSSFTATTIPEPSGYLLSLLGLSYLFTRRLRHA